MKINEDCKRAEHDSTSSKPSQASHTLCLSSSWQLPEVSVCFLNKYPRDILSVLYKTSQLCCGLNIYTERRLIHSIRPTVTNDESLKGIVQLKIQILPSFPLPPWHSKLRTFYLLENTNVMFSRIFTCIFPIEWKQIKLQ